MFSFLASLLTGVSGLVVDNRCPLFFIDEPECPTALIK